MKKLLVVAVIFLFIGLSIIPSTSSIKLDRTTLPSTNRGKTLYVGGSGEGNYSSIQAAINDASDGDTVFVFDDSSPYQLSTLLIIEKSINLIGENRDTTVISGSVDIINGSDYTDFLIGITTDWVNISGFTIQNSERCGIAVDMVDNINISGNIFINNGFASIGIYLSNYSYISDNIFTNTNADSLMVEGGLYFEHVSFTSIIGNIFTKCIAGISIYSSGLMFPTFTSNSNVISRNLFDNNNVAMLLRAENTLITRNTISNHTTLFNLFCPALNLEGRNNIVTCNNFINNIRDANNVLYIFSLQELFKIRKIKNIWDGNYWGRPLSQPKFIFSHIRYERGDPEPPIRIPWIGFDMHPAEEPYDINVTQNYDIDDYFRTINNPLLERFPLLQQMLDML